MHRTHKIDAGALFPLAMSGLPEAFAEVGIA
jgi:hypothetical protein